MTVTRRRIDVFACSDGGFYTPSQIRRRCRVGTWRFCLHDRDADRLLFETTDCSLLMLVPAKPADLPPWIELRREAEIARAVDTRRATPP